jgi:UDP-N-acetylmuramoylalanine--D-glutamate ligase
VGAADLKWGLATFEPIEHRLEPVGTACGADWFNDSKATNPDAVSKALASFDDRPLVVLLGGRNKGNDFTALATEASERCSAVVLFGESAPELVAAFRGAPTTVRQAGTLAEAVSVACELSEPGAAVLLSPACASFDEFEDYADRGREFRALVAALAEAGV